MGNLREKLLSFFLLLFISMPFYVSAFPEGAGTCNVEEMATIGHKATNLKSPAGYSIRATMQSPGNFVFSINGSGSFKGLLVYVLDSKNTRLGAFSNLPSNIKIKSECTGQTTVTHENTNIKNLPFNLNWAAPQGTNGNLTIKSLVVKDFSDWAKLDDVALDPVAGTTSTVTGGSSQDTTTGSTGSDNFLQKYTLFIIMIGITTLLYIVGSVTEAMLKRQQVKSRSFAKTIQNGFGDSR